MKKLKKCKECSKPYKYLRRDLCGTCYSRYLYRTNPRVRELSKIASYKWKKEHPERAREIGLKAVNKYNKKNREKTNRIKRERWANDPDFRRRLLKTQKKYYLKIKN